MMMVMVTTGVHVEALLPFNFVDGCLIQNFTILAPTYGWYECGFQRAQVRARKQPLTLLIWQNRCDSILAVLEIRIEAS
jgi:hypothetical protein